MIDLVTMNSYYNFDTNDQHQGKFPPQYHHNRLFEDRTQRHDPVGPYFPPLEQNMFSDNYMNSFSLFSNVEDRTTHNQANAASSAGFFAAGASAAQADRNSNNKRTQLSEPFYPYAWMGREGEQIFIDC